MEERSADGGNAGLRQVMNGLFSFIAENRELCTLLLGRNGDEAFLQRLNFFLRDKYRGRVRELCGGMDEKELDGLYGITVFGVIGMIHCWLESGCAEPAPRYGRSCLQAGAADGERIAFIRSGTVTEPEQTEPRFLHMNGGKTMHLRIS